MSSKVTNHVVSPAVARLPMNSADSPKNSGCCLWKVVNTFFSLIAGCFKKILPCFFKNKNVSTTSAHAVFPERTAPTSLFPRTAPTSLFNVTTPDDVEELLQKGCNPLEKNARGWTPAQQKGYDLIDLKFPGPFADNFAHSLRKSILNLMS